MLFALAIGSLSLRTRGFQFIMVTLAFAQMVYYFAQSLRNWGGDDGFTLPQRNHLGSLARRPHHLLLCRADALVLVAFLAKPDRAVRSSAWYPRYPRQPSGVRRPWLSALSLQARDFRHRRRHRGLAGALMANHAKFVSQRP